MAAARWKAEEAAARRVQRYGGRAKEAAAGRNASVARRRVKAFSGTVACSRRLRHG